MKSFLVSAFLYWPLEGSHYVQPTREEWWYVPPSQGWNTYIHYLEFFGNGDANYLFEGQLASCGLPRLTVGRLSGQDSVSLRIILWATCVPLGLTPWDCLVVDEGFGPHAGSPR